MNVFQSVGELNALATEPFGEEVPLMPVALIFVLMFLACLQWRAIVDRIDRVV